MSFSDAIHTLPDWVRLWVLWLNIVTIGTFAILLLAKATWREAAVLLGVTVAMVITMLTLYAEVGFVRLLGLPHLIFWIPLVIWLIGRLRRSPGPPALQRWALWALVVSYSISLGFDAVDVARYLLGERASMLPPGA